MRTPDNLCLICNTNKSNKTNSHFIPAGLLKSNVGKRDNEFIFVADLSIENNLSEYFGRSNINNQDPVIKQNPHAADFIFCDKCEKDLSALENKYIPFLNSINDSKSKFLGKTILEFDDINIIEFKIFIYTLMYRLNLQSILKNGLTGISDDVFEMLRANINTFFNIQKTTIVFNIDFLIFTTLNKEYDQTQNIVVINLDFIVPLFLINDFHLIPVINSYPLLDTQYEETFGHYINNDAIVKDKVKICIVELDKWLLNLQIITNSLANKFKLLRINSLMEKTNWSFDKCDEQIMLLALDIHNKTAKEFGYCYEDAYNILIR